MTEAEEPEQWDVFISYAGEDRDSAAQPLAEVLRESGLKVWFDKFELRMGDSLRERIDDGLANSRFGIVILSPDFFEKHWTRQELNGLAQREVAGTKIILPVWHNVRRQQVLHHSPMLADRFAARWSDGVRSVAEEVLAVVREALPNRFAVSDTSSTTHSSADIDSLVLFLALEGEFAGRNLVVAAQNVEVGREIRLEVAPDDSSAGPFLSELREHPNLRIGFAYQMTAFLCEVSSATQHIVEGRETWDLRLVPVQTDYGAGWMETSFANYSREKLAELRARRILLNETLPPPTSEQRVDALNHAMLDLHVQGTQTPLRATQSPFPELHGHFGENPPLFLKVAQLSATLWLRLTGVVERILRLDLRVQDERTLAISFEGRRARVFQNSEPPVIRVNGACQL